MFHVYKSFFFEDHIEDNLFKKTAVAAVREDMATLKGCTMVPHHLGLWSTFFGAESKVMYGCSFFS